MKKILVTGGAGFIGSHTVVELVKAGMKPVIVDNFSNSSKENLVRVNRLVGQKLPVHTLDCRDAKRLDSLFKEGGFDGVIHFAGLKYIRESFGSPLKYHDNNLGGLIGVLGAMNNHGVKKIIFSSSCTVYGEVPKKPLTEKTPFGKALSPYGATKQMGEKIIADMAASKTIKAITLRYFNVAGAHPSGNLGEPSINEPIELIPKIIKTLAENSSRKLVINGKDYPTPDGTCVRDYIHVQDLARAHVKALQHLNAQKAGYLEAFNVGTGRGDSVLDVIKTFEQITGKRISYSFGPRAKGDASSTYASVHKVKRVLGWQPEYKLEDSLRHSWQWRLGLNER